MKVGNIEVFGVIYKIENLVNHKVYIGQTTRGLKKRYYGNNKTKPIEWIYNYHDKRKNGEMRGFNKKLYYSIKKYGFDNFEVIENFDIAFSRNELNIKEICWISIYDSINIKNGYNTALGGYDTSSCYKGLKYSKEQIINAKKLFSKGIGVKEVSEITNIKVDTCQLIKSGLIHKDIGSEYNNLIKVKKIYKKSEVIKYYEETKDIIKTAENFDYTIKTVKRFINRYLNEKNNRYRICNKCGKEFLLHKNNNSNNRKNCYKCSPVCKKSNCKNKNTKHSKNYEYKDTKKYFNSKNKDKLKKLIKYENIICETYLNTNSLSKTIKALEIDFTIDNEIIKEILNKNNILIIPQKYSIEYISYYSLIKNNKIVKVFRYKWQLSEYLVDKKICKTIKKANDKISLFKNKDSIFNGYLIETIDENIFNENYNLYDYKNDKYEIEYRNRLGLNK